MNFSTDENEAEDDLTPEDKKRLQQAEVAIKQYFHKRVSEGADPETPASSEEKTGAYRLNVLFDEVPWGTSLTELNSDLHAYYTTVCRVCQAPGIKNPEKKVNHLAYSCASYA